MRAEITYNAGLSCTVKSTKFVKGITRVVIDPMIIEACQNTSGFAVRVLKPVVMKTVTDEPKPAKKSDTESKPSAK